MNAKKKFSWWARITLFFPKMFQAFLQKFTLIFELNDRTSNENSERSICELFVRSRSKPFRSYRSY